MIVYDFSGKVVLVTGGTSGIGLSAARSFAASGARLALLSRDENAGQAACAELARAGAAVIHVPTDVRDEAAVAKAVDRTLQRFGRLDIALNAAGIGGDLGTLEHTAQSVWDDVLATNARGVWLSMRHQIPAMLATGGGAIVNMSSIYGAAGKAAHHAYVASKHAVLGMTRSVALEFANRGVRVNALCAGVTGTPAMRQAAAIVPEMVAGLVAQHPMQRMATEQEITHAALFLCSDAASYITGTPLAVDGGFLAA